MSYTQTIHGMQDDDCEPLELSTDQIIDEPDRHTFLQEVDRRLSFADVARGICQDFETGCVDAVTSLERLEANHLTRTPDDLMTLVCAGIHAVYGQKEAA